MNTLVSPPQSQTKLSRKPTLPAPPENELPIDRAIRLAGVAPISPTDIASYKRKVLLDEKLRGGIPYWWSGEVQEGIVIGVLLGTLLTAVCLFYGLVFGMISMLELGVAAGRPYLLPPAIAFTLMVLVLHKAIGIPFNTPFWCTEAYRSVPDCPLWLRVPQAIVEVADEIKLRLPAAKFRVMYLEYSRDPILEVRHRRSHRIRRDVRYLAIWDENGIVQLDRLALSS